MAPSPLQPKKVCNSGAKLRLLIWKNFLLQTHYIWQTIIEIVYPVFLFVLFAMLIKQVDQNKTIFEMEHKYGKVTNLTGSFYESDQLIFTPNNLIFENFIGRVTKLLQIPDAIGVANSEQFEANFNATTFLAAIEFHHSNDTNEMPINLAYSLRLLNPGPPKKIPSEERLKWDTSVLFGKSYKEVDLYTHKFLTIQHAIARAFADILSSDSIEKRMPQIEMQEFPTPAYRINLTFQNDMHFIVLVIFFIGFYYAFLNTVRFISVEKEKQLKETMKIMGLANSLHYLGWFIRTIIMLIIPMTMAALLLTKNLFGKSAYLPNSSFILILILFIGYSCALITFSFFICTLFARSKTAATVSMILWSSTTVPYLFTMYMSEANRWVNVFLSILPNSAICFGIQIATQLEDVYDGLNWRTAFKTVSVYEYLTFAWVFGILIFDAIIYFLIALYIENVFPGANGVAKPWYFLFTRKFWNCSKQKQRLNDQPMTNYGSIEQNSAISNASNFESEPTNRSIGIEIRNLTKQFTVDKAVVNDLSLNIFENQITSLLGHNGAGKTTIISMLTGMIDLTSGTALINGHDIRSDMDAARLSMGFCPQHNILFDELTVGEHIEFYCRLKGLDRAEIEREFNKYAPHLDLGGKLNTVASALSGGTKRKLSVIIALCGHSKVVFLDEPTSGLDPGARRALWNILLAEKKDRTILLTTHFMDEADVLSDRIAILADGELKCTGSSFFLKKRFGTGYHLICEKKEFGNCDSSAVTELLQKYIPDIQIESENETEVSYLLAEEQNELFASIFEDLEDNESELKLTGFGVSLTTLEEIFLKLGKSVKIDAQNGEPNACHVNSGNDEICIILNDDHQLVSGFDLLINQVMAIIKKRYLCWLRTWPSFVGYNLFVVFMLLLITFDFNKIFQTTEPPLDIKLDAYKSPVIVLQNNPDSKISTQYEADVDKSPATLHLIEGDMRTYLLEEANKSFQEYKFQYLAASTNISDSIIAMYNQYGRHTAPLSLTLIHNAVIKAVINENSSIFVTNAPLPFSFNQEKSPSTLAAKKDEFILFMFIIYITYSIYSAMYITIYIEEKECNAKFLQYASGVNVFVFWGVSILWDILLNSITIVLIILVMALVGDGTFQDLGIILLVLFFYNFAMIPIVCLLSLVFKRPSAAINILASINLILVPVVWMLQLVISIQSFKPDISDMPFSSRKFVLFPYPLWTMGDAFYRYHLYKSNVENTKHILSFGDNSIGLDLLVMLLCGILAYILLVFIEKGAFKMLTASLCNDADRPYPFSELEFVDEDVLAEKMRIKCMPTDELKSQMVVMKNVSKFYDQFCAVNRVSVSIKKAECFGLLGKNGAGKSSIFKMLTGETKISDGEIFTQGFNQKFELSKIYQMIGYCPQFDAVLNNLTCRETLTIFAMLRGIPVKNVKNYIENCARSLDFIQHIDKKTNQLSGGNKRKLSTSLAIMGNVGVIFLDEPSTGMDPKTKRNLWDIIIKSREAGKSIVLTSHNMEECEALCTRITVLVNGKAKCLGSIQHLKNKFCKGFELKVKVKNCTEGNNMNTAKNFVINTFNGAIFREEYQGILTYSVPVDHIKWSFIFSTMENAKRTEQIDDYSISQNSLEQVVLMFFKDQQAVKIGQISQYGPSTSQFPRQNYSGIQVY